MNKPILSPRLRNAFDERMQMIEREHMHRIIATIQEFEAVSTPLPPPDERRTNGTRTKAGALVAQPAV